MLILCYKLVKKREISLCPQGTYILVISLYPFLIPHLNGTYRGASDLSLLLNKFLRKREVYGERKKYMKARNTET